MACVAADDLGPLPCEALDRVLCETVSAGHFFPDQQAQCVSPIKKARVLDFLMLANSIKAHGLRKLHVAAERVIIRCRQPALRPIALVEDHPKLERPSVQNKSV